MYKLFFIIFFILLFKTYHSMGTHDKNWHEWQKYFHKATCPDEICKRNLQKTNYPIKVYFSKYEALKNEDLSTLEKQFKDKIYELQKKSLYKKDRFKFQINKSYVIEPKQGEFIYSHKESPRQISDHKLVKTVFQIENKKITHGSLNTLLMADSLTGELGRTNISSERVFDIFHYIMANDLDIISLQEVFSQQSDSKNIPTGLKPLEGIFPGERARLVLIRLLTLAGYNVVTDAGKNNFFNGKFENSGLLIASKFKIQESKFYSFTFDGKIKSQMSDRLADKGILKTNLLLNEKTKIIIYNTHTQASLWEWNLYNKTIDQAIAIENKNIKTRIKQYKYLSELLQKENDYKLLICSGDFNLSTKHLSRLDNTLIFQEDPNRNEVASYKIFFEDFIAENFLEEDTWISEYHKKEDIVFTGDYRINGVVNLKYQGLPSLKLLEKKGDEFLSIQVNTTPLGKNGRTRPKSYNVEWSLINSVAFDQVLYKYKK